MINITAVPFTGYPVTDMARARAFYEGVLGLTPGDVWEHEDKAWVEYTIGPATIAVTNMSAELWKPSNQGPAIALEVEDFEAAIAHLRAAGVSFVLEPTDSPVCRLAVVSDPDGNSLAIHKKNPAA
jgi:predicted enzyme related to lactoylglutathione lyase